ncbi:GldG family protein [Chloroflexota bacterium]
MQNNTQSNSSSGPIAVLGLLSLLVGLIVMILLPGIRYAAWLILALGVILLTIAFVINFRRVSSAITGRRGRFSTGTTVMASTFVGIILLVNAISIGNYHRFDATGVAQFTLTSQTKDVLNKLETPVQALCFFTPVDPYGGLSSYITNLLTEYQNYTDKLEVEIIDPDEHPDRAREYGISTYSTVVFKTESGRRLVWPQEVLIVEGQEIVAVEAEHAFTSAILEVTGIVQKKVYFLSGHGESSINTDYSQAKDSLLDHLYKVATLDLIFTRSIPEDTAALIIARPQKSLASDEVEVIERYLENGGRVLILANPNSPQEIKQLLSAWDVAIEDGTVIDPSSYAAPSIDSPSVPRIRNFFGLATTYFPGATAIIPQEEAGGTIEILPLVWTSKDSWQERNFDPLKEPVFNEEIDLKGPLALGVLITTSPPDEAEKETPEKEPARAIITPSSTDKAEEEQTEQYKETLLIVFGDSDFASNQHFYNGNNSDLFLNAVNLLTAGKELITIERKALPFRRLVIGQEVANFIRISSVGLLPLFVLIVAGVMWWRRR